MSTFDLVVRNARLADGRAGLDIGVTAGRIAAVERGLPAGGPEIDAGDHLVSPPFVDPHFHMDTALSIGVPRHNQSGTLLEGIQIWGEGKPSLTADLIKRRALAYCDWAVGRGLLAIRSHVDIGDPRLMAVEVLLDVKRKVAPYLDLQLVAFPQDGYLRAPKAHERIVAALDRGVDVVGGIPHFERTMADGAQAVRQLCELAAERGLRVDMHCDESDDPMSRHVEALAAETVRCGLQGRVTGSHLTSMHSMDNYYVSKLIPMMAEAQLGVIANPLINITLQGRHDTYPKRRGLTRVPELMAAGLTVAFGHDCMVDPFYPMGSGDMLEVASMGLHVAHMTSRAGMRADRRVRRCGHLGERHRSVFLKRDQKAVHQARRDRGARPDGRNGRHTAGLLPLLRRSVLEELDGGFRSRHANAADRDHRFVLKLDQDGNLATQTHAALLGHRGSQHRGYAGIHGIASLSEHSQARGNLQVIGRGDHFVQPADRREHGANRVLGSGDDDRKKQEQAGGPAHRIMFSRPQAEDRPRRTGPRRRRVWRPQCASERF